MFLYTILLLISLIHHNLDYLNNSYLIIFVFKGLKVLYFSCIAHNDFLN
jgi:hypothetical protein